MDPFLDDTVHQLYFGWNMDTGSHSVIGTSMDDQLKRTWRGRLMPHARVQQAGDVLPPARAWSYFRYGDGAALMSRFDHGHTPGRTNAHVIVASPSVLTARLALRLTSAPFWRHNAPVTTDMQTLRDADLANGGQPPEVLHESSLAVHDGLLLVLSHCLEIQNRPMTIVGCDEELKIPLLWGLVAAMEWGLSDYGTFSTYYASDRDVPGLPNVVFIPEPRNVGFSDRMTVDLRVRKYGRAEEQARALLHQFLGGGQTRHSPIPTHVIAPRVAPAAPSPAAPSAPPQATRRSDRRFPAAQKNFQKDPLGEVVQKFLDPAVRVSEFVGIVDHLRGYEWDRGDLRRRVDPDTLSQVACHIERAITTQLMGGVVEAFYGTDAGDLREGKAREHAIKVIDKGESGRLAQYLVHVGLGHSDIASAGLRRWTSPLSPDGPRPRTAWAGKTRLIALTAAAIFLVLIFMLGYITGTPAPRAVTETPPASTANPAPVTTAVAPISLEGTVLAIARPESETVFSFVRIGDRFFPQGMCVPLGENLWRCEQSRKFELHDPKATLVAAIVGGDDLGPLTAANPAKALPWQESWGEVLQAQ